MGSRGLLAAALPTLLHNPPPHWVCQRPPCHEPSPPQLPVSTPPTGLDECFFFISLVVGLPYSSIFCQFWLFFVFELLLSFFWWCEEAQCVYLCLHLGQKPRKIPGLLLRIAVTDPHSQRCLWSRCYYFLKATHFIPICIHD